MVKLSERLQRIADCINKGETVADIGSDHGFLPLYLREQGISPRVVLTDIRPGPLEKAAANIAVHAPGETFDLRQGDGLAPVEPGETDVAVIAGMGGQLIMSILQAEPSKTDSFKRFILQPRNAQDKLRKWLYINGFTITEEYLVREGRHICEIIVAAKGRESISAPDREAAAEMMEEGMVFEISPLLILKKDPLLKELIQRKIRTEEKIWAALNGRNSLEGRGRIALSGKRLRTLRTLLLQVEKNERTESAK